MDIQVPINKRNISIPDEVQYKWQTLLDTIVEVIHVPVALIAKAEPHHIYVFLYSGATQSLSTLNGREYPVESYCSTVVTTGRQLLVANALKQTVWKRNRAVRAGMISYLGLPLFWPDIDMFGILCVLDTKENHYTGNSQRLMAQYKDLIETDLAMLCKTQQLESLLESLGDIKESYYPDISSDAIITTNNQDQIISWNLGAGSIFGYTSAEIVGKPLSQFIADPFRKKYENMRQLISEDSSNDSRKVIEVVGVRKDGIELPIVLTYTRFKSRDELLFTAVIRTVAKRKRLGEMIQSRDRELNILNRIAQSLSQALKLDEVLHRGLDIMIDTMDMTAIAIYLTDEDTDNLSLAAESGITEDLKKTATDLPLGQQSSLKNGQYALTIPLISRNRIIGSTLFIKASEFQDTHIQLIQGASNYLAATIDNACLFEKTESMSITDNLTGLYNQRYFHNALQTEIDRLLRYPGLLSLVMLDLDGFKEFNDQYGHVDGDKLLRCFAQTLKTVLRKTDYAFRYGGDEFAVILPLTTARKTEIIINRFRKKWVEVFGRLQMSTKVPLEFSVGIAEFPQNAETPDTIILLADSALYESKRQGKHTSTLVSDMGDITSDPHSLQ